jgi:hypothetical protein
MGRTRCGGFNGVGRLVAWHFRAALVLSLVATAAGAQETASPDAPDPANVRMRIGPLLLNPTISLTNIGVDDNVFNQSDQLGPKRDFTLTVTPQADFWLRMGPTWVTSKITEDLVWYQQYQSERTANTTYVLGWRVPLSRLSLKTNAGFRHVRDRPGFEIDARSQRTEVAYDGLVEIRALSKTFLGVMAQRQSVTFDKSDLFLDRSLYLDLNRVTTGYGAGVRYQLTTLTALSVAETHVQDRFDFQPLRDSNSTVLSATVSLDPLALIKGSATIGYRDFAPSSRDLPSFKGTTAAVNLSYTLLGMTKFGLSVHRDVEYSYDIEQAYYLLTGITGSIAQQVFGPFDVVIRGGEQSLAYRNLVTIVDTPNRVDHVRSYGGGVGYHLGKDVRVGFNVDRDARTSVVPSRQYTGLRLGSSVTYGY